VAFGLSLLALAAPETILLADGSTRRGTVESQDDAGIAFLAEGATESARIPWDSLEPNCAFRIRRRAFDPSDADGHLALADFCAARGLPWSAIRELEEAVRLDPARAPALEDRIEALRRADAEPLLSRARQAMAERRWEEAARLLRTVIERLIGAPPAEDAAALLEEVDAAVRREIAERAGRVGNAPPAERTNRLAEDVATGLAAIGRLWSEALDAESAGRADLALAPFGRAFDEAERVRATLEKLASEQEGLRAEIQTHLREVIRWRSRLANAMARIHLEAWRLDEALRWANETLRLDPDDEIAHRLRLMITERRMHP
jgi:tetratricopeptide (TPR) repeat protein